MPTDHASYRHSITIRSNDLALVNCLRSLAQFSQQTGNNRIPWGGTTDDAWRKAGKTVTFRFTSPAYRDGFVQEVRRLLPDDLWEEVRRRDDDPATPQAR